MKWLYHSDYPEGRLFEDNEKPRGGWVDTPAKLKPAKKAEDDGDGA